MVLSQGLTVISRIFTDESEEQRVAAGKRAIGRAFGNLMSNDPELVEDARAQLLDTLTGILNRAAFIHLADNDGIPEGSPVLFLDLNGFKNVNDTYGHRAGDMVLKRAARILRRWSRIPARLSGDEFAAVLNDRGDLEALRAELGMEFEIEGVIMRVPAAIGIGYFFGDIAAALKKGDKRMYYDKRRRSVPRPRAEALP
jgi:diguanylate cyclase (GGDEF)-like protein